MQVANFEMFYKKVTTFKKEILFKGACSITTA